MDLLLQGLLKIKVLKSVHPYLTGPSQLSVAVLDLVIILLTKTLLSEFNKEPGIRLKFDEIVGMKQRYHHMFQRNIGLSVSVFEVSHIGLSIDATMVSVVGVGWLVKVPVLIQY